MNMKFFFQIGSVNAIIDVICSDMNGVVNIEKEKIRINLDWER